MNNKDKENKVFALANLIFQTEDRIKNYKKNIENDAKWILFYDERLQRYRKQLEELYENSSSNT